MIKHYFITAIRNIKKYPSQNLICIIGLAVGLLSFSICLYCSRYVINTDRCFKNYDRLIEFHMNNNERDIHYTTHPPLAEEIRNFQLPELEAACYLAHTENRPYNVEISKNKVLPYIFNTIETDSLFATLFTPTVICGSWQEATLSPNAVIMAESTAKKIFGTAEEAIGKQMIITRRLSSAPDDTPRTGGATYIIKAVINDFPSNTSISFMKDIEILTLNDNQGTLVSKRRYHMTSGYAYGLLKEVSSFNKLKQTLKNHSYNRHIFDKEYTIGFSHIGETFMKNSIFPTLACVASIIGVLILLTGLLNFFQFLTGTILNRTREYSLRKMLGNNLRQLFTLLFLQCTIMISIALLVMLCMMELLAPYLNFSLFNVGIAINKTILIEQSIQYISGLFIVCGLLSLLVSLRIQKISIQQGTRGVENTSHYKRKFSRDFLLGLQFFICWIFVSLTAALYEQSQLTTSSLFNTLSSKEKENILSIPMNFTFLTNQEKYDLIMRIQQHEGIKEALYSKDNFTKSLSSTGILTEHNNPNSLSYVYVLNTPPNFFSFMNVPLIGGKVPSNEHEMIIDKIFANRIKKGNDIYGLTLYNYNDGYTVTGISEPTTISVQNTGEENPGFIFLPYGYTKDSYIGHCYIKCHPAQKEDVRTHILQEMRKSLPESVIPIANTFADDIREKQAIEVKLQNIIFFFSIVSLIITLLGVYSAITLDTERRRREVAIRKVNGAGFRQIIWLFGKMYLKLLTIPALIAFPLVYLVLQAWKQMYTIFFDYGIFFWASIFTGVTVLTIFTVSFRILQITRINPAETINRE